MSNVQGMQKIYIHLQEILAKDLGELILHALPTQAGGMVDIYMKDRIKALELGEFIGGFDMPGQLNSTYEVEGPRLVGGEGEDDAWVLTVLVSAEDLQHVQ